MGFALNGLDQLPDSVENRRLRLDLLGQRVTPIIATRSYASPELNDLIDDAMSVYAELDHASEQIFPILYARWAAALTGGRAVDAPDIAAEVLAEAQRQNDELKIILGNRLSGCALVMVGQPVLGLQFLERALVDLGDSQSDEIGFAFGQDSLASCLTYSAYAFAALGDFAKMYQFTELAAARGEKTANPLTIGYVYGHLCMLYSDIRDFANLSVTIDLLADFLRDHPIPVWTSVLGYVTAQAKSFDSDEVLAAEEIRSSLDTMGFVYWRPIIEANLARVYLARGEIELAEKSIENGNRAIDQGGDSWGGPELARVQADLMLASDAPVDSIDEAYSKALAKARDYPNKVYELRSACGLARHYMHTGRAIEARDLLRATCETVAEPCGILDFAVAKELLSQLAN